jgi:hypothetical protein
MILGPVLLQSDPVIVTSDIGNPGYKQHFFKASADSIGPLMLKCSLICNSIKIYLEFGFLWLKIFQILPTYKGNCFKL